MKLNLKYSEIPGVDQRGRDADGTIVTALASQNGLLSAVFQAEVGLESDPVETPERGYIWFDVLKVTPGRLKSFAESKAEVAAKWLAGEERALLAKKGQEIVDKLRAGETLPQVAETFETEVKETKALKRSDTGHGLPNAALLQAFALKEGAFGSAAASDGKGRVIFRVAEVAQPAALDSNTRQQLERVMVPQIGDDLIVQYVRALRTSFGVNINQGVFEDATAGRAFSGGQRRNSGL